MENNKGAGTKTKNTLKKIFNDKNIMRFVFFTFIGSIVYISIKIILAPSVAPASDIAVRAKSDYLLMLFQSVLGAIAMWALGFLQRKVRISIPSTMIILYAVFLYCAVFLGEVRNFYYSVPHWDTILHTFSGAALGALGFSMVSLLNKSKSVTFSLSPIFVALFAFCFALMLGVMWEIFEFAVDSVLGTNMQKFALETGEALVGQTALADTMKDLIVDALGAFAMSAIGYISLKYNKNWLDGFHIKKSPAGEDMVDKEDERQSEVIE